MSPTVLTRCADCGIGTITLGEWYTVKAEVWEQAWSGRRKLWHALPGQQILCIGCLEDRIGRTLMKTDFADAPINDPTDPHISQRMRDRLTAESGYVHGENDPMRWLIEGMVKRLPPEDQERAREAGIRAVLGGERTS